MKKSIALLVCLLLCVSAFLVACGGDEDTSSQADNSKVIGGDNIEDYVDMPEFVWKGQSGYETFNVCITSDETAGTYYCEDVVPDLYTTTDQALNTAVTKRNDQIFNKYGVEIVGVPVANVAEAVRMDVSSALNEYDAALPYMSAAATLAQEGFLYDLYDFKEYIHFDQPWWDSKAEKALTVGGKLYFTTGDITIMTKIVSFAMTFNKEMLKKVAPDYDIYQSVRDGEWTFDKMVELSTLATADSDGVAGMSENDTWGLSSSYSDTSVFYLGSGNNYVSKNSDDLPELMIGSNESSVSAAVKVLDALQLTDSWVFHCDTLDSSIRWNVSLDVFGQNRCLFRTSAFSAIKKLRAYVDAQEFGIVPIPKLYDTQDDYYTYCNCSYSFCAVIPTSLNEYDAQFSAYMLDLMAFGGMKHITPAYYETTLKYRDLRDEDSGEMLDKYIFNNVVYDLGNIYNFGGVQNLVVGLMTSKTNNVASTIEANKEVIENAIKECIEAYDLDE